jgi:hypothetical protein
LAGAGFAEPLLDKAANLLRKNIRSSQPDVHRSQLVTSALVVLLILDRCEFLGVLAGGRHQLIYVISLTSWFSVSPVMATAAGNYIQKNWNFE